MYTRHSKRQIKKLASSLLLSIFLLFEITLPAQQNAMSDEFAITGALIYPAPGETPIPDGVVIVGHGKIMAVGRKGEISIPKGMQVINCTGQTLVAGFWNTHVHFMEPKWNDAANLPAPQLTTQMQDMLTKYGFTSVVDIGSALQNTVALRRRVTSGEVKGPRIMTAGSPIFPKDGIPYYVTDYSPPALVAIMRKYEAATAADATRIVDEQLEQGADVVKLMAVSIMRPNGHIEFNPMALPVVQAATAEAHSKGKLVFAHPTNMDGIELVLAGHVDVLAHTSEEPSKWDNTISQRLKAANVTLIPTLTLFDKDKDFDEILKEVKSYSDIGGQIMFGTDIGFLTDYPSLTREFGYLSRAGLTFPQILASLTTVPATRLGFAGSTGAIKKGLDADLVVLDGDPVKDQSAFYHVAYTIRQGHIIYQKNQ
jgi:imidazolonepropionase-like amidohydrolase